MSIYKRGETWWYTITLKGHGRVRGSTGTTDKEQAQRKHDEVKAELWNTQPSTGAAPTWHDACIAWLAAEDRGESDRYTLRALNYPNCPLTDCTADSFKAALAGLTPGTYNRKRNTILAILHMAGVNIHIPARAVTEQRIRYLTADEWDRLDAELPPHLQSLARFALATGLRQSNVTQLKWDQVDMDRQVAWIHPEDAKAGKAIGVPLPPAAMEVLVTRKEQYKAEKKLAAEKGTKLDTPYVFLYKGKPIAKIKTAWTKALTRAGIEHFRWHDLRHTWASWHVMAGTPLEVLKELGGWSDYKMVLVYAHLSPDHLAHFAANAKPYRRAA